MVAVATWAAKRGEPLASGALCILLRAIKAAAQKGVLAFLLTSAALMQKNCPHTYCTFVVSGRCASSKIPSKLLDDFRETAYRSL